MNREKKLAYLHYLKTFVTQERQEKIKKVLALRTRHITVALEDVSNSQNVAAIMRTCEAMGLQEMYAIEYANALDIKSNVARGAVQWMELHRYQKQEYSSPIQTCINDLKAKGFMVIATSPHATKRLSDLSLSQKYVLLFGTENTGLSDEAFSLSDEAIALPQYGFVESYNVAVSAALCLYDLVNRLRVSDVMWKLQEEDAFDLEIAWLERSLDRPEVMRKLFFQNT